MIPSFPYHQVLDLNVITEKEKRKKVEEILFEYRKIKSFLIASGALNIKVPTREAALFPLELRVGLRFVDIVDSAIQQLDRTERSLIRYRYLEGNTVDYIVKDKLGVSERSYYRIKAKALKELMKNLFLFVSVIPEDISQDQQIAKKL